jgi:hypothetical protein
MVRRRTRRLFDLRELGHEIKQMVVCRRLRTLRSSFVVEYWNTRCARRRFRLSHRRRSSNSQTAMYTYLPSAISRLPAPEKDTVFRVSERLPGLHPIHLHWFGTRLTACFFRSQRPPYPLRIVATMSKCRICIARTDSALINFASRNSAGLMGRTSGARQGADRQA